MERSNVLGYTIEQKKLSFDKNIFQSLLDIVAPKTFKELKAVRGLIAYYDKWITYFSS